MEGCADMGNIYGDVEIKRLEGMKVASFRVVSRTPEDDVIEYMKNGAIKNGLDKQEGMRNFGFDVPVSEEQKKEGLRGYEYWITVTDTVTQSDGVTIKNIDADEYAVLRIVNPFNDPFNSIPNGWKMLRDWVMNGEYKTTCFNNRYWLEEVIQDGNNTYMDIYFPVKDGGREGKAEIINFSVTRLSSCKLIGKEIKCMMGHPEGNPIPAFWCKCMEDGTFKTLEGHQDRVYTNASIGWMGNFNAADNTFTYVVGVLVKPDALVPEGMVAVDIPGIRYAVGTIRGTEPDIYINEHIFTESEMQKSGLQINGSFQFEMEWYDERFCQDSSNKTIDYYIPVE
jgi:predicted transcriptional regulator YdeE